MIVKCPICKKPVEWSEKNPWRPFCSERCKLIDLGEWASDAPSFMAIHMLKPMKAKLTNLPKNFSPIFKKKRKPIPKLNSFDPTVRPVRSQ